MYTLENLRLLNAVYDSEHRLEPADVEIVNRFVSLIEDTRKDKPCPGDNIEYTDENGDYSQNAHIRPADHGTGQLSVRVRPHIPFVYREDDGQLGYHHTGGGHLVSINVSDLTYVGKCEKMFAVLGNCYHPAHSAIYFKAAVNAWEYTAPNQKYPGFSTKDWARQYMCYVEKPHDGSEYHYYGNFGGGLVFRNAAELQRWMKTYKAVEFPGSDPNHTVLFHYREQDVLVTCEEWDALDLPLDTRRVNGIIHVKVDYDDNAHMITVYRFTNAGYLDPRRFTPYERAKGTKLVAPEPDRKKGHNE